MPFLDHFGLIAPYYDRLIRLETAEKMIEIVNLPVKGALLDAGGGTGRVAEALHGLAGSLFIADLSLQMLKQAHRKDNLIPACSQSEYLPFSDETFERIIMVDALHHVNHHSKTAGELWRVLKPGGRLVIEEPDIRKFSIKLVALAEKLALMRSHFLSAPEIVRLFPYQNARAHVKQDGFNAWVVIDKLIQAN